jgi:hypothetical protein
MEKNDYIAESISDMMYDDDTLTFCDAFDKAHREYERFLNEETILVNSFIEEDLDDDG